MTFIPPSVSKISTQNGTTTPLAADATYTGVSEVVTVYSSITVNIVSDVSGAAAGISIEFSQNGTNWDIKQTDTYTGGTYNRSFPILAPHFRLVFTNGDTLQASFRLQCVMNITKPVETTIGGSLISLEDSSYDAFSRIRHSEPFTLFRVSHNTGKRDSIMTETTANGATSTYTANESCVDLAVTTTTSSEVIRQSREYIPYLPGKSFLIMCSGVINSGSNGVNCISRIGLFDDQNGVFFQFTNTNLSINVRSYTSGSAVTTSVISSSWNIDKMDGTGPSGIIIDATKSHIFIIDLAWLGVGRVRFGFIINGKIYYVHQVLNANSNTTVYMTRASLPVRYQLTGGTSGAGAMKMICSTVISEGGKEVLGTPFAIGRTDNEGISVSNTFLPIIAIRLKSGSNRVLVDLTGASIVSTSSANIVYRFYRFLSPASSPLTNESWVSSGDESSVEYDISSTAVSLTNGILHYQNYMVDSTDFSATELNRPIQLTSDIAGTSDMIILVAQSLGISETLYCSAKWREFIT